MQAHEGSNPSFSAIFAQVAQSVEQGTENPCVSGSIPLLGTKRAIINLVAFFILKDRNKRNQLTVFVKMIDKSLDSYG